MYWPFVIAVMLVGATAFILGRVWSIKDFEALRLEHHKLQLKYEAMTTRGPKGRFIKRDSGAAL